MWWRQLQRQRHLDRRAVAVDRLVFCGDPPGWVERRNHGAAHRAAAGAGKGRANPDVLVGATLQFCFALKAAGAYPAVARASGHAEVSQLFVGRAIGGVGAIFGAFAAFAYLGVLGHAEKSLDFLFL